MNNVILWYIYNYYIYICVQNRDEHFTHNNHLDISSWYPHYGWLLLVKFSLLFLNTSDRYRKISHCILYLHYITTIYIYFLFFFNAGSAIFVHWSRANTLMVQRSFLPAEDWRTSTMILLLKTTFLLIERTTTFCCHNLPAWITFFPFFLSKILEITKISPFLFPLHFLPPDSHLGSDSIGNGSGGEQREIVGSIYGCFAGYQWWHQFFLAGFGDHIQKWNFRWGIQATWEFHQQNMWVAIHSGFNSGTLW